MPERKKRRTGTSRKGKKTTDASSRAKSLLLKEIESLSRFPAENPNVVMRISKDGNVLYSNNAGSLILNEWKCQVGQPVPAEWHQLVSEVLESGTKKEVEEEHGAHTFLMMFAPIVNAGYVNVYGRDITERKKAEEQVRQLLDSVQQEKDRLSSLVNSLPDEVWFADKDRKFILANPSAVAEFGFASSSDTDVEKLALSLEVYRPDGSKRPVDEAPPLRALKGEIVKNQEELVKTPATGELRHRQVNAAPVRDRDGNIVGSVSVVRDITELKNAEEELRKARDELETRVQERTKALSQASEKLQAASIYSRSLIEASLDPLVTINAQGKITDVNKATEEATGFSREQLIGSDFSNYFTDPEEARRGYMHVFSEGFVRDYPLAIRHKSGKVTDVLYNATVYKNEAGQIQGVLAAARDVTERKQAEETVRAERKRFIDVMEKLPAYLILLTPDHQVSYANRFFRERFGENRDGKRCYEYLFNRSEPCEICETYKTLEKKAPLEWEWTGPDGHIYYIYDSPFTDIDGSNLIMEVGIDITERKKAEAAVQAERKRLYEVLETLPQMVCLLTPDYHVAFANRSFRERFGESQGRHCYEYCYGQAKPCEFCESYNVLKTGKPHHWEVTTPDSAVIDVYDFPFIDVDGSPMILEMDIDITERKKAEEAVRKAHDELETRVEERTKELKQSAWELQAEVAERKKAEENLLETRNYLENLIDYANAPIIVWNREYRITRFNHAFERLTGLRAEDVLGKPLGILFPEDSKEESMKYIHQTASGAYWETVEIPILRADGALRTVLWNSANILGKDGVTIVATVAQGQDITERNKMQAKLEEYSQHLEQLVEQKTQELKDAQRLATIGETASMVGHDIRNPLQSIEGAIYLAKEEVEALPDENPGKKELKEILEIVKHQTNYIDHIVADLQDFSRTPMPQVRETDLHELVTEALLTTEIPENVQVQTLIQDDLKTVRGDPVFIKRILLNLVENAVHAMPQGGKLTVKAFNENGYTIMHVEDTGVGISEENKPKMFTPLFTTKSKGQGFGLAVCKKLVEAHSGEITFESELGKGTIFKIKLPQREQAD